MGEQKRKLWQLLPQSMEPSPRDVEQILTDVLCTLTSLYFDSYLLLLLISHTAEPMPLTTSHL